MFYTILAACAAAFALWAMVDLSQCQLPKEQKVRWFAVVILIPLFGPMLYHYKSEKLTRK
jgi:hypothetical protein